MKLLAIDGNSLINRAYYGVRPLTTKDGVFTNAVFGFTSILLKLLADVSPDAVAVAFDRREPTFRHRMYNGYKAGRHKAPDELLSQFPLVRELLSLWGMTCVDCEGFEADDILGTLARSCSDKGWECVIATGDRDSFQLIAPLVSVQLAKTAGGKPDSQRMTEESILAMYGVTPRQMIDVKSIMGDSSDNIPGVTGIGEKGALMLIQSFGSLDGVYQNLTDPRIKPGMRDKLATYEEQARMSRVLAEIVRTVPVDDDPSSYLVRPADGAGLKAFLTRLEMFSMMSRLPCDDTPSICTPAAEAKPVSPSDSHGQAVAFVLPEKQEELTLFGSDKVLCADKDGQPFAADMADLPHAGLITDDAKAAVHRGIPLSALGTDVSLAAYLLNPSSSDYSVPRLCDLYGIPFPSADGFSDNDAAAKAACLPSLWEKLQEELTNHGLDTLLYHVELPLAEVLAHMEQDGVGLDFDALSAFRERLSTVITETEQQIYLFAGETFNINSPKQLGTVLFETLDLPAPKKTGRGYSTDAETLESLRGMHPIIDCVLTYRQYTKLRSTYCDGLQKARAEDGRVRSTYNQTETRTGRISSSEPNLQNIPVRTELGREMRRFFVAKPGYVLVDADYSQIELRVLAHLSADEEMCRAFTENKDIHTRTASQIFGVPESDVTPLMRSRAKTVNFGIVYGIGAFSLSKDLHITRKEADSYINSYFGTFSGVRTYMDRLIAEAKESGQAVTMMGRRRLLPELTAQNHMTRAFGERVARNMPIQGTAADIIKLAMVKVYRRLKDEGLKARLILQVHDELIVEAPEEEALRVALLLTEEMEQVCSLRVPLVAEAHIGKSWADAK